VREIEERAHREMMLERERNETSKTYGNDILARVKAYQKEATQKKLSKEEITAGARQQVADVRAERMAKKKKLLDERSKKVER